MPVGKRSLSRRSTFRVLQQKFAEMLTTRFMTFCEAISPDSSVQSAQILNLQQPNPYLFLATTVAVAALAVISCNSLELASQCVPLPLPFKFACSDRSLQQWNVMFAAIWSCTHCQEGSSWSRIMVRSLGSRVGCGGMVWDGSVQILYFEFSIIQNNNQTDIKFIAVLQQQSNPTSSQPFHPQTQKKMNFVFIPNIEYVPEWKQCYFDNKAISNLLACLHQTEQFSTTLALLPAAPAQATTSMLTAYRQELETMAEGMRREFYAEVQEEMEVFWAFSGFKVYEIQEKYREYVQLIAVLRLNSDEMLMLLENLYIEVYYLRHALSYNESHISNLIQQYCQLQPESSSSLDFHSPKLPRMRLECQKLQQKLERAYTSYCMFNQKKSWNYLLYMQEKEANSRRKRYLDSLYIGLTMGGLLCFICILVLVHVINDIGVNNSFFVAKFPVWRGGSEIIFYIWILGLDVLIYEQAHINYKLIFFIDKYNLPSSKFFFELASTLSFIYLLLFLLFMFELVGAHHTGFRNFAQVFWLIFLIYFLLPLPILHYRGRVYLLKMLGKIALSFCFPMNFMMIWMTQQIVSLIQPLTDLFYTVFYFCSHDVAFTKAATANANSAIVITVFFFRMVQNLKFWHQISQARPDKCYDFWAPAFIGAIRAIFGFLTGITALLHRLKVFPNTFALWIVVIILSTLVAWYVDVKGDWALLNHQKRTFLRPKLLFPFIRPGYYFILFFNLLLRTAWVLTISSFFVDSTGVQSVLYVMLFSFIEIFRRGIWNILRIENEQVRNCEQFQATIRDQNVRRNAERKAKVLRERYADSEERMASAMELAEEFYSERELEMQEKQKDQELKLCQQRTREALELFKQKLALRNERRIKMRNKLKQYHNAIQKMKSSLTVIKFWNSK